jgi:hypothetical protein
LVSRALGFGYTTAAPQSIAAAQTIAVTPFVDALAGKPELAGQNADVLDPLPLDRGKVFIVMRL